MTASLRIFYRFFLCVILHLFLFVNAQAAPTVWDVLRSQLKLDHQLDRPEVQKQLHWIKTHPDYLKTLADSQPYMYHILTEIKARHLPGELALIPMIESSYNPFVYSHVGAAGLWQLMPETASDWGLKRDWWYDPRRSIRPSTDAALNYFKYLNHFFHGNWTLAIAAYDCGEGALSRIIKGKNSWHFFNRTPSFWNLPVPQETKAYVPRLLALAAVIKSPEQYHIKLPDIPHQPYFEEVNVGSQIDLSHAAHMAGITYKELIKLNAGFNRWATPPNQPFKLLIPKNKVALFLQNLALTPHENRISWAKYEVKSGDTIESVAKRHFTTVKLVHELNRLSSNRLRRGQLLLLPSTKNAPTTTLAQKSILATQPDRPPSIQTYKVIHIVQPKDDFAQLEKTYQVDAEQIRQWNHMTHNAALSKGQQLIIWKKTLTPGTYTVKKGDSLNQIARNNSTTVEKLKLINKQVDIERLTPGQVLLVG